MDLQETEHVNPIESPTDGRISTQNAERRKRSGPWFQYRVPHGFEWNRYTLPIAALPPALEGLRIAQLTDLHLRKFWSEVYDQLIERVRQESPDLILLTGDFIDNKRKPVKPAAIAQRLVSKLKARLGCYGILGNHDRRHFAPYLEGTGVTLLDSETRKIEVAGAEMELLALPGVDRRELTPSVLNSYPEKVFGVPRIVLAHFPDEIRKVAKLKPRYLLRRPYARRADLGSPGGFPPIRHDSLPRRLCKGVHRASNTWLVVSRGLGFTGLPLRLFCPAEVVEITLTRG